MKPEELPSATSAQLLDVRLPDDFEAAHLTGAKNNCVFEVAFASRLPDTAPDPAATTIVYGANHQSQEAEAAIEKLRRLGYQDLHILEGGLQAAQEIGIKITQGNPVPITPVIADGSHKIDLAESKLEWLGRNLINKHWGTAALESGELTFEGGNLTGGKFIADLTKLECTDLAGSDMHDYLISHLHNEDFFDVEYHPKATFIITKVEKGSSDSPGAPNLTITGDLTLRGQTHPITFQATTGITEEGKAAAQASFSIDRTRWGILYGSGKFFNRLAGHLVNDELEFQLRIITQ